MHDWPRAARFASIAELAASELGVDAVEVLTPIDHHEESVIECLRHGWHVKLQQPLANDLASASPIRDAARRYQREVRVMENHLFYEPLCALKAVVESGKFGEIAGYHFKVVASGRGRLDVPGEIYEQKFEEIRRGHGTLFVDDGWHKLSTARWLLGPVVEVRAWTARLR